MTRYFLVYFLLLIAVPASSQKSQSNFVPLTGSYPAPKNLILVNNTVWNVGTKGLKSMTLSFNDGDTVLYSISRERIRKATFSLLDSGSVLFKKRFKANIISGGFVVQGQGAYIFKVKNHSFLGNNFSLELKKAHFVPKIEKEITPDTSKPEPLPQYIKSDSIVILLDTTVYLACTLNLNQPSEFTLPYIIDKEYDCIMEKYTDVSLKNVLTNTAGGKRENKSFYKCQGDVIGSSGKRKLVIYLHKPDKRCDFADSLAGIIEHGKQICRGKIGSESENQNIVAKNEDKVVGKYVHIQLKEIKTSRKLVVKDVK